MAIIEKKYTIDLPHVKKNNLLTNYGILTLLESIACLHSNMVGYGINNIKYTGLTWILLNWKVRVLKRVSYGTCVVIKTWARPSNKFFTLRDFEIYDENGNIICIASSKWVLIDIKNKGITKITDTIMSCYEVEDKSVFNENDISKLKIPELPMSPTFTFSVQRKDIDVNNHMHNTYYLNYAYESLPEEIYNSHELNEFEIMYKNGAKLNNNVNCYYICENNSHLIIMKSIDNKQLHAVIKLSNI